MTRLIMWSVKRFPDRFAAEAFAVPQAELSPTGWQLEPQAERNLLARLRAGGTPLYTEFQEADHAGTAERAYCEPELMEWVFRQQRP